MPSIVAYQASHFDGIRLLWRQAFPSNSPKDAAELSFPANLSMQPDLFLVAIDRDMVVGSAVASIIAGYDGHRGWLYAVAVLQSHQRQGIATNRGKFHHLTPLFSFVRDELPELIGRAWQRCPSHFQKLGVD